jgi:hypothetical protein
MTFLYVPYCDLYASVDQQVESFCLSFCCQYHLVICFFVESTLNCHFFLAKCPNSSHTLLNLATFVRITWIWPSTIPLVILTLCSGFPFPLNAFYSPPRFCHILPLVVFEDLLFSTQKVRSFCGANILNRIVGSFLLLLRQILPQFKYIRDNSSH